MIKESFAKRLKEALKLRGVSQAELSKRTGINRSSISTYLKGEYKAKQDKVDLIAQALNVSPAWLMGFDIQPSGIPKLPHGAQMMILMKLQKMIRDFRALNGLTQEELGKRIGVSKAYIGMLEKGIDSKTKKPVNPSLKTLHNLAIAMGYNPEEFYSILDEDTKVKMPKLPYGAQIKKVPMLGYAAAGRHLEDLNQDVFYVDIENKYDVDFCITVAGDSMTGANIYDGDIVFIKKTSTVSNGQIACIQIDREKVCLKRFYKTGDTVQLISENPKYPPMLFTSQNCESLQILGLAIIKQSEVK